MFGTFPCYPGFKDNTQYANTHFYCSSCHSVVRACEVPVLVVDKEGNPCGTAGVMRCQGHPIKGSYVSGPITTLWGLRPRDAEGIVVREHMRNVCLRVRNLDVSALLSWICGSMMMITGVILGVVTSSPIIPGIHHWSVPAILLGIGFILFVVGFVLNYFSRVFVREWLSLSKDYVERCDLLPVQRGTEAYAMLTDFPPSCRLID